MPYIDPSARRMIDAGVKPINVGELTYKMFSDAVEFLGSNPDYARHAQVLAAIESTKLEFYRQYVAPYEDSKIAVNGPVCRQST